MPRGPGATIPYPQRNLARGYRFQDLIAALSMAGILAEGSGTVAVEVKRLKGDIFDDVTLALTGQPPRRAQVKHFKPDRSITRALFTDDAAGLKFNRLMTGWDSTTAGADHELRIVTTLSSTDAQTEGFTRAPDAPPFATGLDGTRWRLPVDRVWPADGDPLLPVPENATRDDVRAFCDRLVIEADAMPMSGELARPGALEHALIALLRDHAGVERYPNLTDAVDVASRLLEIAGSLRNRNERQLNFAAIAHECGLRVDRGRVVQAFPLDRRRYVPHVPLRDALGAAIDEDHRRVIVEGPPGAGKSWALEALAQDLHADGSIVARHYCFLAPGDPDVGQRIAVEAMTANLTAELLDDPRLHDVSAGLGGDLAALELVLERADATLEKTPDRIVLIVDGLDHVARIEPPPGAVPVTPSDLAAQLGLLRLPDRVMLVVGSQPGAHLQTLADRGAHTISAPRLQRRHTAALLARQGVLRELRTKDFADDHATTVAAVHRQAAGNPLYAGFLGREVLQRLGAGEPRKPSDIVASVTGARGDLEAYYRHLLATAANAPDEGLLAEHLALVDFPVTIAELDEILDSFGRARIERIVGALRPILDDVGTQGGLRIHHESFRRFIVDRLRAEGRRLGALLDPIIAWLDGRGLFRDERAYRSLLPLLRRADRGQDLLDRIGPDFVSRSVVELQPQAAIAANLDLAARVAADRLDFPALVRIAELRAAVTTTFREKLADPTTWAEAVIELDGPDRLVSRLLYDGRPTWPREAGLRLCAVVDQTGGTAPWREYLALRREHDSTARSAEQDERYVQDELRGVLRTTPSEAAIARVARWIDNNPQISERFFEKIASELGEVLGATAIAATRDAIAGLSEPARAWLELGLAEGLAAEGATDEALVAAHCALAAGLPPGAVRRLLDLGMPASELTAYCPEPADLPGRLITGNDPDYAVVDGFLSSVLVAAASGADLAGVRDELDSEGFYPAWLRFCCDVAEASAGRGDVVAALEELSDYDEPFAGRPRACDLYRIHGVTVESFARAAALIADADWPRALHLLLAISAHTTTSLQNNPSGPLTVWALLHQLLPYAERVPLDAVHRDLELTWRNNFYEFHAEASLAVGRLDRRAGRDERADATLAAAGRYLAAYGFHKDVTVFGLIEALEPITDPAHHAEVVDRFRRLFPLCDRAYRHSDGRETSHAASVCFAAFARRSPGTAADALARTVLEDPPARFGVNEDALDAVLSAAGDRIPVLLHHLLWRCCTPADVQKWLKTIDRLAADDEGRAREAFAELAAAADGDTEAPAPGVAQIVTEYAVQRGWPEPAMNRVPDRLREAGAERQGAADDDSNGDGDGDGSAAQTGYFADVRTPLDLLVALRRRRLGSLDGGIDAKAYADELLDCLNDVVGDDPSTVLSLMEAFCHEQRFLDARGKVLERVAQAYSGHAPAAAEMYVLAWIGSRDGWDPFGGLRHRGLLERAFALDRDAAMRRLAREMGRYVQTATYVMGVTRRAAEGMVVAGRQDVAVACWDQAAAVVEHRLPTTGPERASFAPPGVDLDDGATPRAYAGLLGALVHASDPERRATVLAGIAELLSSQPDLAAAAATSILRANAAFTDTLVVTRLLELATPAGEIPPYLVDWLPALAAAPGFGLQESAGTLLDRRGEDRPPRRSTVPAATRTLTESRIAEALIWDARDRVERLSALHQPFARMVAGRYWDLFNADREGTLSLINTQAETQFSRTAPWLPPWFLHRWEAELFEIAIHDAATDLAVQLAASGRWPMEQDRKLHDLLSADVGGAVARARSRTVRPADVPLAGDREAGEGPPLYCPDGPFEGWLRVGLVEQEIRPGEKYYASGTLTRVASGLWNGDTPADSRAPFGSTSTEWRWHVQRSIGESTLMGPLATYWEDEHLVLYDGLLSLAPTWMERLGLRPAPLPAPLDLVDADGARGAMVRYWRMRPYSYDYSPPSPTIRGVELLLRPDLAAATGEVAELTEVTRVLRRQLAEG
ncbi:MAG: hypothetical protein JWN65_4092 [Solirubrobacterales bacterium]|nr:hypothetical protein [Solirubrobacterales bacterium]